MPQHSGHKWDVSRRDIPRSCPVTFELLPPGGQVVPHQSLLVAWAAAPRSGNSMEVPFISWQDVRSSVPKSRLALPPYRLEGDCAAEEGTDGRMELPGGPGCAPHQEERSRAVRSSGGRRDPRAEHTAETGGCGDHGGAGSRLIAPPRSW